MVSSRKRKTAASRSTPTSRRSGDVRSKTLTAKLTPLQTQKRDQLFDLVVIVIVLALGIYLSWLYFGHQAVPNSDFIGFIETGHAVMDYLRTFFQENPVAIQSFKRMPGLGLLQVGLSCFLGGDHPELTAGWLLNAILYCLTGILLYLIGKRFLGKNAVWFTILLMINPLSLNLLRNPIAEITLRFFIVLSVFTILKRSRWRYLAASMTTIIRYDGAAVVLAALVMDLIPSKSWRRRFKPIAWSMLAMMPMTLWFFGGVLDHKRDTADQPAEAQAISRMEYLNHYDILNLLHRNVLAKYSHLLWLESVGSMLGTAEAQNTPPFFAFHGFGDTRLNSMEKYVNPPAGDGLKIIMIICLSTGIGYGLHKKQGHILLLLLFALPYFLVHSLRYGTAPRHTLALTWVILLLCIFGLQSLWKIIKNKDEVSRNFLLIYLPVTFLCLGLIWLATDFIDISIVWLLLPAAGYAGLILWKLKKSDVPIPKFVPVMLQVIVILAALGWMTNLGPYLSDSSKYFSPQSTWVPFAAIAAVIGVLITFWYCFKIQGLFPQITLAVLMVLFIISNQFTLTRQVGAGANDLEFKNLARWFLEHAQPNEKMVCTLSHVVKLYAPKYKDNFVLTELIAGDTWEDFIADCRHQKITYVAWDSRMGLYPQNSYYKSWKVGRLNRLATPNDNDNEPFILVDKIQNNYAPNRLFIYIYRLN